MIEGKPVEVLSEEVEIGSMPKENYSVTEEHDMLVGVYTVITEDLESEGLARDIVRRIQALRKEADFDIDDHIIVYYTGDPDAEEVFNDEGEYIMAETLTDELHNEEPPKGSTTQHYDIDGLEVRLGVVKK